VKGSGGAEEVAGSGTAVDDDAVTPPIYVGVVSSEPGFAEDEVVRSGVSKVKGDTLLVVSLGSCWEP